MNPVRAYDYLMLARAKLFDWIRPLSQERYTQEFPFGLPALRATMVEIAGGEWIYARRLGGESIPPEAEWPINEERRPTFADLEPIWRDQAPRTRALLGEARDWNQVIESRVQRPDKTIVVTATTADIATQLCFHEIHHRAQAMAMLRQLGVPAQDLDYSLLMYRRGAGPA